jgi:hypothetical protein
MLRSVCLLIEWAALRVALVIALGMLVAAIVVCA